MSRKIAMALAMFALSAPALAQEVKAGDIRIERPWSRATPKGAEVGVGYLVIRNDGIEADRLIGGASEIGKVELHEMNMDGGVMKMREMNGGLAIAAHSTVTFAPGGYHLMFIGLKSPLTKGQPLKATLHFERAGNVAVEFDVRGIGAAGPGAKEEMKGMKM